MAQRHTISGRRSALVWLSILIGLALIVALAVIILFVYPNYQRWRQVEQHYQAGVAFQETSDWDKAVEAFERVVAIDATYKDAQTRLTKVKTKQQEALATVQARATAETQAELEASYQRCLGAINLERWEDAKAACDQVFAVDPNYKDVQARLKEAEEKLAEVPTTTSTLTPKPTPSTTQHLVEVRADLGWQNSGIFISAGEQVAIQYVSGGWAGGRGPLHDASGDDYVCADVLPAAQCVEPIPDFRKGALVGRVGEQLLKLGNSLTFTAVDSGSSDYA